MRKDKEILQFFSEAGLLKKVQRSGWWVVGIKDPETVAEHSFRCAVIGYVIAKEENVEPYMVLLMTLFNDIHEARINDLHKMAQRYINLPKAEDAAFYEQIAELPKEIKKELSDMRSEYTAQESKVSIIARDADLLECLIQAKEYYEQGITNAKEFMRHAGDLLQTDTARKLWQLAQNQKLTLWWKDLASLKR